MGRPSQSHTLRTHRTAQACAGSGASHCNHQPSTDSLLTPSSLPPHSPPHSPPTASSPPFPTKQPTLSTGARAHDATGGSFWRALSIASGCLTLVTGEVGAWICIGVWCAMLLRREKVSVGIVLVLEMGAVGVNALSTTTSCYQPFCYHDTFLPRYLATMRTKCQNI